LTARACPGSPSRPSRRIAKLCSVHCEPRWLLKLLKPYLQNRHHGCGRKVLCSDADVSASDSEVDPNPPKTLRYASLPGHQLGQFLERELENHWLSHQTATCFGETTKDCSLVDGTEAAISLLTWMGVPIADPMAAKVEPRVLAMIAAGLVPLVAATLSAIAATRNVLRLTPS
jgi:hypothetical protein